MQPIIPLPKLKIFLNKKYPSFQFAIKVTWHVAYWTPMAIDEELMLEKEKKPNRKESFDRWIRERKEREN